MVRRIKKKKKMRDEEKEFKVIRNGKGSMKAGNIAGQATESMSALIFKFSCFG